MNKRIKCFLLGLTLTAVSAITACGDGTENGGNTDDKKIKYEEYITNTISYNDNSDETLSDFNTNLYYLNQWEKFTDSDSIGFPDMGDPFITYYDGAYYAYGTRGTTSFHCFRSYDLSHWERLTDCFTPAAGSWSRDSLWAPDIQCINGKYYLYYTGRFDNGDGSSNCQIGVAVADAPYGPFIQFTGTNALDQNITLADTPFKGLERHTILDQTVFRDDDGTLYMYFSFDAKTCSDDEHKDKIKDPNSAEIWGVRMIDATTWDISTLTPLLSPGYKKLSDDKYDYQIPWERWSPSFDSIRDVECLEGPYMIKHNGKYFLTYCANSFVDECYSVGYAISDSPLGEYVKPNDTYLENMLLGVPGAPGSYIANRYKGFTKGTGHASIFRTGSGELMFAYHAHYNRETWDDKISKGNWRVLSVDYLYFDENGMPYTNGPTYSLQRTPEDISGYTNIAGKATIKAEGENAEYLNDNYTNRAYNTKEVAKETTFKSGTRSIEIKFDKQVKVRAINVYNSYDKSLSVDLIRQIDFGSGRGIVNANFNYRYYSTLNKDFIYPHCAFNIELEEDLMTDRIVITIDSDHDFALGEIEVLGNY